MFSVCLFTGGPPPPTGGGAPGGTPQLGGAPPGSPQLGGRPQGSPPNLDKNVGQNLGQKMDKVLDKKWTKFWTKNWINILETFGCGGRGRYASCGHAGGLSCLFLDTLLTSQTENWHSAPV